MLHHSLVTLFSPPATCPSPGLEETPSWLRNLLFCVCPMFITTHASVLACQGMSSLSAPTYAAPQARSPHALLTTFSPLLFVSDICLSSASFQAPSLTTSLILLIGFWPSIFFYSHKFSIEAPWSFSKLKIKTLLYLKTFSGYHHVQEKLATPCEGKDSPLRPRFLHSSCISIYYYMWSNQ